MVECNPFVVAVLFRTVSHKIISGLQLLYKELSSEMCAEFIFHSWYSGPDSGFITKMFLVGPIVKI